MKAEISMPLENEKAQADLPYVFSPFFGILFSPSEKLRFGVSYYHKLEVDVHMRVAFAARTGFTDTRPITLDVDWTAIHRPTRVSAGVAWQALDKLLLSLDLTWFRWSAFKERQLFVHEDVVLDTSFLSVRIGSGKGPETRLKDTWVPRIGIEYGTRDWLDLRCGYFFSASPVPDQTGETNLLDSDRHVFSVGAGFTFRVPLLKKAHPFILDTFFQYTLLEGRAIEKDDPTLADYRIEGHAIALGLLLSYNF